MDDKFEAFHAYTMKKDTGAVRVKAMRVEKARTTTSRWPIFVVSSDGRWTCISIIQSSQTRRFQTRKAWSRKSESVQVVVPVRRGNQLGWGKEKDSGSPFWEAWSQGTSHPEEIGILVGHRPCPQSECCGVQSRRGLMVSWREFFKIRMGVMGDKF